ncbi:thiamine biosynthetic bifunctional enzyme [[Candida] anglica]|uniref:Thiamine biosynthetic bifunctional enzyme n=1 Tax=[Candida] anglica TaxID=148631 RepID=A0ABP0EEG5_9ASCO
MFITNSTYRTYLVTDSTMIPESSTFIDQVTESIMGGASMVQLREKTLSTRDFIERAKAVRKVTKEFCIPLIINDRIDVALAVNADGVHVGQDDMPAITVRKILGEKKLIGVTCSNPEEVKQVCEEGVADYIGVGTVFKTNTKKDVKDPKGCGPIGIRKMLKVLGDHNRTAKKEIKVVAIGGINHDNAGSVLYQCSLPGLQSLTGLAVVSCIMASEEPKYATADFDRYYQEQELPTMDNLDGETAQDIVKMIKGVRSNSPLVHHITNNVVKNFSANVTLALGASPIMSELANEFEEFTCKFKNLSLVLNLGTPIPEQIELFKSAMKVYNAAGHHIVFDPVAAGASLARLQCCKDILNAGYVSVIKGNLGEISALLKLTSGYSSTERNSINRVVSRGVDSVDSEVEEKDIFELGEAVARDFKCVVVITGSTNYIFDGICLSANVRSPVRIAKVPGGSKLMGSITGTGCSLGSTIGAFLAGCATDVNGTPIFIDPFSAVWGAVTYYNVAGSVAGKIGTGPGSFMINFLDCLNDVEKLEPILKEKKLFGNFTEAP